MFSGKRSLVTGGAGLIGSHLCERLLGLRVGLGIDNHYIGSRDNIVGLLANPQFEPMRHDVILPLHVEADEIYPGSERAASGAANPGKNT